MGETGSALAGLGIDLGSTAVRVGVYDLETDKLVDVVTRPVPYTNQGGNRVTQGTEDIMSAVYGCIEDLNLSVECVLSCGVAATCSLAVFTKGESGLEPLDIYSVKQEPCQNVMFWMDSSATLECDVINETAGPLKEFMGGSFIPEMGIPKLASIIMRFQSEEHELEVLDLHSYIAYQLALRYGWDNSRVINKPNENKIGHDGEVKGWDTSFYRDVLKLPENIKVGPIHALHTESPVRVASCIDCYSNWFSMCSSTPDNSLFMAAGTSTCYLYTNNKNKGCIPGVWGPFTNILDGSETKEWSVYEAGQSTTGKLIEHLFETHPAARVYSTNRSKLFSAIESTIEKLERESGESIHFKSKHMFTYGELQGNRTPYCDSSMSGMFIGETTDTSFYDLVLKYITILEFLAFQVKHIKECFKAEIKDIRIAGSQAKNTRLLSLVSLVNDQIKIRIPAQRSDYMGVEGAYLLGKAAQKKTDIINLIDKRDKLQSHTVGLEPMKLDAANLKLKKLLVTKYKIYLDMPKTQMRYRAMVDSV
ncbi:LAQU0S15e02696g1_1 [Lachancea quebecensis]|uniref:LAQU0S15e02696g1_1 n=1 Tax=Lachancea quebecensis TaxID=1654605 RepID=A0A0P1KVZ9_9SACH|nr:LAQU0S15e02696g1_1 [Lachancea quebecensis]